MNYAKLITALVAIMAVTALELAAIGKGIDGALFGVAVAFIAGIAGYESKPLASLIKRLLKGK